MLYKLLIWATPPDPTPHQKKKQNKKLKKIKNSLFFPFHLTKKTVYLKLNINMEINLNVIVLDKIA